MADNSNSQSDGIFQRMVSFIMQKICLPGDSPHESEVAVEFRHTDGSDHMTNTLEQTRQEKGSDRQTGGGGGAVAVQEAQQEDEGVVRKNVTVVKEDKRSEHKKGPLEGHDQETKPAKPPRHWGPLLSVASNINQRAESFIRSRKKAMGRSSTLDPNDKSS